MLAPDQLYQHSDGRSILLGQPMDETQAVGEIFLGTLKFGPLSVGIVVTEDGLHRNGYELQEPEPEPEPEQAQ